MTRVSPNLLVPFLSAAAVWDFVASLDMWVMRMGLDRIETVLKAMGQPQNQVQSIHLVGTNGKGSTSAMLESVYRAAGFKSGLFTSPHLVHVKERIQIEGQPVPEMLLVQAANRVARTMAQVLAEPLTYFEFLTALAFACFETAQVDIALIEAGLGGRLDSTNVIDKPLATVISPISMDHQDRLGHTLEAIAQEKAAVIRTGVPVVVAPQHNAVVSVVEAIATQRHAPMVMVDAASVTMGALSVSPQGQPTRDVGHHADSFALGLLGGYQQQNVAVVLAVVDVLASVLPVPLAALEHGLCHVSWPGRFQWMPDRRLVVDGSHNEAGIAALLQTLALDFAQTPIDWGIALLANRNPEVLRPLLAYPQTRSVTWLVGADSASFHHPEDLNKTFQSWKSPVPNASVETLAMFLQSSPPGTGLRVVTGSLYQAGEALQTLKV